MPSKTKTKTKSKKSKLSILSNNKISRSKKLMFASILIFGAIGTVAIFRSFAATTVVTFNPATGGGAIEGLYTRGTTVVQETDNSQKKPVQTSVLELSRGYELNNLYPSYLDYKTKLNTGYYLACFNVMATTKGASAALSVNAPDIKSYKDNYLGTSFLQESPEPSSVYTIPVPLNSYKESCVDFAVSPENSNKEITATFNVQSGYYGTNPVPPKGTWKMNAVTIKLNTRQEATFSNFMSTVNSAIREDYGTGFKDYSHIAGVQAQTAINVYKKNQAGTIKTVDDTIGGVSQKVAETTKALEISQRIHYPQPHTSVPDPAKSSTKQYKACVMAKSMVAGKTATFDVYGFVGNNAATTYERVTITPSTTEYTPLCVTHTGIKAGESLTFRFSHMSAGSIWRVSDAWVEEL